MPSCRYRSLRGVLHFAVAKGPVLRRYVDEADPDILLADSCRLVDVVYDLAIKCLLHFNGSTGIPGDLNEHDPGCVVDAKVSIFREDQVARRMCRDDDEFVVGRDLRD